VAGTLLLTAGGHAVFFFGRRASGQKAINDLQDSNFTIAMDIGNVQHKHLVTTYILQSNNVSKKKKKKHP
jgi:hypothetical protein